MSVEIFKSFGTLQSELEQAKSSLKGFDENIKRLIGRDPSEFPVQRQPVKRHQPLEDSRNKPRGLPGTRRVYNNHENFEPPNKRRSSVFNRLSDRVVDRSDDELDGKAHRHMISKVIVTPKEIPSRQDAMEAQSKDEKSKARNRRMFGALLGTLQRFQQEETKLKDKEDKRALVEKKIEEIEIREKAEIKKERRELFFNRKKKQVEIKMIVLKMNRMKDYTMWEELQKPRTNFIMTKATPHIHYLPRRLNEANKTALIETKANIEKMIEHRKQEVNDDLQQIEERMKRNFEPKENNEIKEEEEENLDDKMDDCSEKNDDHIEDIEEAKVEVGSEVIQSEEISNENFEEMETNLKNSEHD